MGIFNGTVDRTPVALPIDVAPAVEAHSADNFAYASAQSANAMRRYPELLPDTVASWPTFEIELQREMDALYGNIIINSNAKVALATQTAEAHAVSHPISAMARCQLIGMGNSGTCNVHITSESVPAHFKKFHGINGLNEDILVCCLWEGCFKWLKRKYFVRHIRERHLGCRRRKKHHLP
ncbi:hypothetical protein EV363DRAFT_622262 [Boletus edulis]|nr:hypothetical protein EV363DRAFT_622262 [Boletus edulis]